MIEIVLNGEAFQVKAESTVTELLDSLGMTNKRFAVEYNMEILPKSQHAGVVLQAADSIEIVHAIGGG